MDDGVESITVSLEDGVESGVFIMVVLVEIGVEFDEGAVESTGEVLEVPVEVVVVVGAVVEVLGVVSAVLAETVLVVEGGVESAATTSDGNVVEGEVVLVVLFETSVVVGVVVEVLGVELAVGAVSVVLVVVAGTSVVVGVVVEVIGVELAEGVEFEDESYDVEGVESEGAT